MEALTQRRTGVTTQAGALAHGAMRASRRTGKLIRAGGGSGSGSM